MGMIKAVLFDLDGTTLYTLPDLRDALCHALRANGYAEPTEDEVRQAIGNGLRKLTERSLPAGCGAEAVSAVLKDLEEYYSVHMADGTRPYDGIPEALRRLREEGYLIGTVTNKPEPAARRLMETFFPGMMDVCVGEKAGIPRKPDPAMVTAALKELGAAAGECVYIGDSGVDAETARNSGCKSLCVTWGYRSEEELKAAGAELLVREPGEIAEMIRALDNKQ